MIKLGVCTGIENINKVAAAGFDYLEGNFTAIHNMSDEEYARALETVEAAPIKVESCNCMMTSGKERIAGPDADHEAIIPFLDKAFERAAKLGVKLVVFGSGRARSIPEGFDTATAWRQIHAFLRIANDYCERYGMTVVIEPLCHKDCNMINYVCEAAQAAAVSGLEHIGALGDTYHMYMDNEPLSDLAMAGSLLKHVHVANPVGRTAPVRGDGADYKGLFDNLRKAGYEGRVSIEAGFPDIDTGLKEAYECLNEHR